MFQNPVVATCTCEKIDESPIGRGRNLEIFGNSLVFVREREENEHAVVASQIIAMDMRDA